MKTRKSQSMEIIYLFILQEEINRDKWLQKPFSASLLNGLEVIIRKYHVLDQQMYFKYL